MRHHRRNAHTHTAEEAASPPMYQTTTERWIAEQHIRSDIEHCADDLWYVYKDNNPPRGLCIRAPFCSSGSGPNSSSWLSGHDDAVRGVPRAGPGSFCPIRMKPSLGVPLSLITILLLPCLLSSLGQPYWLSLLSLVINWTYQNAQTFR